MLNPGFKIGNRMVGGDTSPYVIAEAGSNFNQDLDIARKLIDTAAEAGADAVKFQLFRADLLYTEGGKMYDIFKSIELPAQWVPKLSKHAKDQGIVFVASAFDRESVDVLVEADVPAFKVASSETGNLPLLRYIASFGKPVILSTGMCDMVDVEEAVNICMSSGNPDIALLQCGAVYPLPPECANLRVIGRFVERFGCPVGFSDHTLGSAAAIAAVGLGAKIIEKHSTLDRNSEGPDHFYALEPKELTQFVSGIREAYAALGSSEKHLLPKEREVGRREGLYLLRGMKRGEVLTDKDIIVKRPAIGLRSRYLQTIIGARLARSAEKDTPITWDMIAP